VVLAAGEDGAEISAAPLAPLCGLFNPQGSVIQNIDVKATKKMQRPLPLNGLYYFDYGN
jgi:hypothetical protein